MSGGTNSINGAGWLLRRTHHFPSSSSTDSPNTTTDDKTTATKPIAVLDIGGTSTDIGILLPTTLLPRQSSSTTTIAGVRVNFSCPDVRSLGLGGGSVVRVDYEGKMTIGPDSVGKDIMDKALCFGGDIPTATDYALLSKYHLSSSGGESSLSPESVIKQTLGPNSTARLPSLPSSHTQKMITKFNTLIKQKLSSLIDSMKTVNEDIDVVVVGGGAILIPQPENDKHGIDGVGRLVTVGEFGGVANAIGAGMLLFLLFSFYYIRCCFLIINVL